MNRYRFDEKEHLHTLDGKPLIGTSTATDIMGKTLTYWASGLACAEMGWSPINDKETRKKIPLELRLSIASKRFEEVKKLSYREYLDLLDKAYKAHSVRKEQAAETGIDNHALCEAYIKARIKGLEPIVSAPILPFAQWCDKNVRQFLFSEVFCYSENLWTGGIIDWAYIDRDGNYVLSDFKSSPRPYFNQWVQCGGYAIQLEENMAWFDKDGNKLGELKQPFKYHSIFSFNRLDRPFFNYETDHTRKAFAYAVNLHREKVWWEQQKEAS